MNYLSDEINHNDLISKKYRSFTLKMSYFLFLLSVIVFNFFAFSSLVEVLEGITIALTSGIRKYNNYHQEKEKKT